LDNFIEVLGFSFSITMPIFLILALGVVLYKIRLINDNFIDVSSKLVFNVTLPALLFISISKTPFSTNTNFSLVLYGVIAVTLLYLFLEVAASRFVQIKADRGVVVQGAFRSNMGIIGLAYCINAYGDDVFAVASVYLGGVTILFNVLSVITLNRALNREANILNTLKSIIKNPLIISIISAIVVSFSGVTLPATVIKAGNYFAQMTLPLALLCAGATLSFSAMRHSFSNAMLATIGKLFVVPAAITLGGFFLGYRGMELGVLFLMTSAPSASASYMMVKALGGNAELAANIIVLTTLISLLSTSIGVTLLGSFGLI
jgi:malonate transporter and related proteins